MDNFGKAEHSGQPSRQQHLTALLESSPLPIGVYLGKEMRISAANKALIEVWGKGPDIIGKTYFEVLPELFTADIYGKLLGVFATGIPYDVQNQRIELMVNGHPRAYYFNYTFTPLFDENGEVYGVMNTAADVTDLNISKQRAEYSEQNFRDMILQAPVAMCLLNGPLFTIDIANTAMLDIWGKPKDKVMGRPIFQALPDAREQGLEKLMEEVYRTGKPFYANEQPISLIRHGVADVVYQNFVYQPYRDASGNITGILATSVNVTEQVTSRLELEKAYEQVQLSKKAAQLGTFDLDLEKGSMVWDQRCRELFGIAHQESVSYEHDFVAGLHPQDAKRVIQTIENLYADPGTKGDYDIDYRTVGATDGKIRWVRAKGKVYYANGRPKRFIGSVLDVTSQKENELRLVELTEKQARLAAIVSSSDDIIISKTLEGTITSWNPAAERAFGYTEMEAVGKHISIIIPPERLDEEDYILSQIRKGGKVDHFDTVRRGKNRQNLQLSLTVSPVIDDHGNIIGASKIARDISAQVAAQQVSDKYTERLEILNMVISAISEELDLSKILQKVTDATTELTGARFGAFFYNTTDQNGESYTLSAHSGAPRAAFEIFGMQSNATVMQPTFAGEGPVRVDDIAQDARFANGKGFKLVNGRPAVSSYMAVPVTSRDGRIIGGLFFGHPEPARFTMEHESLAMSVAGQAAISMDNAELFEQVRKLNDRKDEFIGLASHELKTPLASINGYLQILERLIESERPRNFLSKASHQVNRLTSLVNDLLDISKIEAGKLQLSIGEFDLCQTVRDSVELIQHGATKHTITFTSHADLCMAKGDPRRIEQVIINLLSNAVKYSPDAKNVKVDLSARPGQFVVSVTDQGPGIPNDKLKHIFSRFYRVDENSPNISGLGIGLYLAHEIISRHNGEIWAENQKDGGSMFTFTLPSQ